MTVTPTRPYVWVVGRDLGAGVTAAGMAGRRRQRGPGRAVGGPPTAPTRRTPCRGPTGAGPRRRPGGVRGTPCGPLPVPSPRHFCTFLVRESPRRHLRLSREMGWFRGTSETRYTLPLRRELRDLGRVRSEAGLGKVPLFRRRSLGVSEGSRKDSGIKM